MALRPFCELRAVSAEESGADGDLEKGSSDGKRSPCAPKEWHPKDCRVPPVALPQEAMDCVYDDGRQHAQYCLVQSARRAPVVMRSNTIDTLLDTLLKTAPRDTNPAAKWVYTDGPKAGDDRRPALREAIGVTNC